MEHNKTEYEIGGKLLIGVGIAAVSILGTVYMNVKNRSKAIMAGIPIKDNSDISLEFDPKTKKVKLNRKNEFEVKETKTIIKEVPVVPGFKKTKKVQVQVDEKGREVPGTQEDVIG
ncbi:hypothetical protein KY492_00525 [Brevibacterium sp. PAMC21349]|nr:hypothetical protein KY492_00525 [Brevibacterium sp. PAMC21349]